MIARNRLQLRLSMLIIGAALVGAACNLGATAAIPTQIPPIPAQKPTVSIQAPQAGADAVVGQAITVAATGSDPTGVTRLELRANDQQVDSKMSQNPAGDQQLAAYLNYTPSAAGSLTLTVIAYRGTIPSDPALVTVNVKDLAAQVSATVEQPAGVDNTSSDPTCYARVSVNGLNFRKGPGQNYDPLAVLPLGSLVKISGVATGLKWWQGSVGNTVGWLSADYITLSGSLCSSTPIVQTPPSPTPNVSQTATPNPTTAVPQASVTTVLPDVTVLSIDGPVTMTMLGDTPFTALYKVTVQNIGAGAAGSFNASLVLQDGTPVDMGTVAALAPGQQAIFQASVTFKSAGPQRLTAVADSNHTLTESDETNNIKTLDVVIIKTNPTSTPNSATKAATP